MNKSDLIMKTYDRAHVDTGVSRHQTESILNSALAEIQKALATGGTVQLTGFGKFEVKTTAERPGRNPKTSEPITIPAGKKVVFKPGAELKDAVNS